MVCMFRCIKESVMKKQSVGILSLFLFLGLSTSISAAVRRVKVFNETGKTINVGIEYKTRIGRWERVKSKVLKSGKSEILKPGLARKIRAIYWSVGGKEYRIKTDGIDLSRRFYITSAGGYRSGKVSGKAKLQSTSYTD